MLITSWMGPKECTWLFKCSANLDVWELCSFVTMQLHLERGKTPEHVRTMLKGVWSNEEPSEHHFKNKGVGCIEHFSDCTGRINDLKQ